MLRRLLIVTLLVLMPSLVKAQGAYYQLAPGNIINGFPTQIYVCPLPDGGFPCPFPTSIYSNSTLTTPLSNPAVLTTSGQFAFWTTPGQYTVQITAPYNIRMVVNIGGHGASGISTSVISPNPAISKVGRQFASPDIDIRNYGAVSVFYASNKLVNDMPSNGGYYMNIATSATTAKLSSSSTGLVVGNYIFSPGAGAAQSMTTPSAPTVTPSVAVGPTGTSVVATGASAQSTTYSYEIVWVDKGGGYTAASSAGSTSSGYSSLGLQSITITGMTQSNNTLTITTAARSPEVFVPNQLIILQNNANSQGYYNVASVPNNTTITVTQGVDTRNGGYVNASRYTTVGTGTPTIFYWTCNRVALPSPPSGAFQALIYGRASGSYTLLGETVPYDSTSGVGTFFDDYGSTMMASPTVPIWAPSTPPSSAQNDALSAQITAISGTSVTLSVASGSGSGFCGTGTCSTAPVLLDDGPAILAAAKASASFVTYQGGQVQIPNAGYNQAWPIQSYVDLSTLNNSVAFKHTSALYMNGTLRLGNNLWLSGTDVSFAAADAWGINLGGQIIVGHAYPAFFAAAGDTIHMDGTQFNNPANMYMDVLVEEGGLPTGYMKNFGISGGGPSDYMGIPLAFVSGYTYGSGAVLLDKFTVSTGPNQVTSTSTPLIWNQAFGEFTMRDYFLNRRGYFEQVSCSSGNSINAESNMEREGGITPMFMFQSECNGSALTAKIHNQIQDSEAVALISHIVGPGGNTLNMVLQLDTPGAVSGYPINYITALNNNASNNFGGQSINIDNFSIGQSIDGIFNSGNNVKKSINMPTGIGNGYSVFTESAPSAAPTLSSPTSGGSLTYVSTGDTITVVPVFLEAGGLYAEGAASPASNSETLPSTCPTSGNCTLPASWTAVTGAAGYDVYLNGTAVRNTIPAYSSSTLSANISGIGSRSGSLFSGGGPVGMNVHGMWVNSKPVTQTIASGTVSLGTSPIASNTCASVVTATASGVLTTDNIQADFNSNPTSTLGYEPGAMLTIIKYPTAGNVNFIVCNNTGNSIAPGAVTLNWRVVR